MRYLMLLTAAIGLLAVGCAEEQAATSKSEPGDALPASLFVTTAPPDAQDISAAKQSAKSGDTITVRGRVGGRAEPFSANRAMLTLADVSLETCDAMPGDACKTPWDSCCEPADEIAAKSATVQVAGADGKPLKVGLNGASGLAPGKQIIVTGTAQRDEQAATLLVNADQIYVTP